MFWFVSFSMVSLFTMLPRRIKILLGLSCRALPHLVVAELVLPFTSFFAADIDDHFHLLRFTLLRFRQFVVVGYG